MQKEELLKPRIIVENNYPRSPFKQHEIICEPSHQQTEWAKEFTLNFRFLEWWEERAPEDMPQYVKQGEIIYNTAQAKHKYKDGFVLEFDTTELWVFYKNCQPASEEEFMSGLSEDQTKEIVFNQLWEISGLKLPPPEIKIEAQSINYIPGAPMQPIPNSLVNKVFEWMGIDNITWFKHVKGLKGTVNTTLKLNYAKKKLPAHPIHLREGMQIRNFLRVQEECKNWDNNSFEYLWPFIIEKCIEKLSKNEK